LEIIGKPIGIGFDTLYIKYNMSLINPELLEATLRPLIEKIVEDKVEAFRKDFLEKHAIVQGTEKPIPVKKMAVILGISVSHLYKKCNNNEMPHHRKFSRLYFYLSEIKTWMDE
jgi:predicted DNA-binding transcriptional regulator AlpA